MTTENDVPGQDDQGLDEGVVVSSDAGTVAGVGPHEALDEIEAEEAEPRRPPS